MASLEIDAEADVDTQMPGLQQHTDEENRRDSLVEVKVEVEVEASEISIDMSLDIPESSENTTAETTTSELADSDLSMTDVASNLEGHSSSNTTDPLPKNDKAEATPDSSVAPEQALDTAAQKVFATYALVEQIFLKLPDVKTIAMARRTNKTFQNVICRSFKIRQRLQGHTPEGRDCRLCGVVETEAVHRG